MANNIKYPNLINEKIISLDIETKDPNIKELGPGYYRAKYANEDSYILCVAVATKTNEWIFDWNDHTVQWLKDNSHLSIIGANVLYDLMWLYVANDIKFNGDYYDILINESLIDGGRSYYNLDKCALKYLNLHKGNDEIKEYCENKGWKGDARQYLYLMYKDEYGKELVIKYNKSDARQTYDIYYQQLKEIEKYNLQVIFKLESDALKPTLIMKQNGIKIDTNKIEKTENDIEKRINKIQKEIDNIAGFNVNVAATESMKKAFETLNLIYPYTDKGNPSFKSDFLESLNHPFGQKCAEIRMLNKLQSTYIKGFEKFIVNGRVYTNFHQVKNGSKGTETGRYSATQPALQTIPKRGEGKKLARALFIPEDGYIWEKQDQSQEEYRILAHFARGIGAEKLRNDYINNIDMDMHIFTRDMMHLKKTKEDRQIAKTINFACVYGGGMHRLAEVMGLPIPPPWPPYGNYDKYLEHKEMCLKKYKAAKLFFRYHESLPFIKETSKAAQKVCNNRATHNSYGYAKTILGRRRYLSIKNSKDALNTVIQGTGGDIMKKWLVDCSKAGLWDILKLHITVHDEIDFSKPQTKEGEEAAKEVQRIGQECIKLKVPLIVDREQGQNWAELKEIKG